MNACGNAHVRCWWNRRSDRDTEDGLVTLSASQSTEFHDKWNPEGKGKEDDVETCGARSWKQTSKNWIQLETVGEIGSGSECLLVAYAPRGVTKTLIDCNFGSTSAQVNNKR